MSNPEARVTSFLVKTFQLANKELRDTGELAAACAALVVSTFKPGSREQEIDDQLVAFAAEAKRVWLTARAMAPKETKGSAE